MLWKAKSSSHWPQPIRSRAFWIFGLAVGLVLGTGCGRPATIRIHGSSTVYPIAEAAVHAFHFRHRDSRITVGFSGTGGGIKKLTAGEIDICNASRRMTESEVVALAQVGIIAIEFEIARDGLAVVVHPENHWLDCLTLKQLRVLWEPGSKVDRWSDLDPRWPSKRIRLLGPGTDSGTFDTFTTVVCGQRRACRSDFFSSEDDQLLVRGVARDRYSLAYFGIGYFHANSDRLKLLGIDLGNGCVKPSRETIENGDYRKLSRSLFVYVNQTSLRKQEVVDFLRFFLNKAATYAEDTGYVATTPGVAERNLERLEERLITIPDLEHAL